MWEQAPAGTADWQGAIDTCEGLSLAGNDDWRLPNVRELQSVVDYGRSNPAINPLFFPDANPSPHWTSTTNPGATDKAYYVDFGAGNAGNADKINLAYVRCVR